MLMGRPIGCPICAANVFEWAHNYFQKAPPMLMGGPIIFTTAAAAEFGWAHNFFGSLQCLWVGPLNV